MVPGEPRRCLRRVRRLAGRRGRPRSLQLSHAAGRSRPVRRPGRPASPGIRLGGQRPPAVGVGDQRRLVRGGLAARPDSPRLDHARRPTRPPGWRRGIWSGSSSRRNSDRLPAPAARRLRLGRRPYIKINARGKALTPFEILKADSSVSPTRRSPMGPVQLRRADVARLPRPAARRLLDRLPVAPARGATSVDAPFVRLIGRSRWPAASPRRRRPRR